MFWAVFVTIMITLFQVKEEASNGKDDDKDDDKFADDDDDEMLDDNIDADPDYDDDDDNFVPPAPPPRAAPKRWRAWMSAQISFHRIFIKIRTKGLKSLTIYQQLCSFLLLCLPNQCPKRTIMILRKNIFIFVWVHLYP